MRGWLCSRCLLMLFCVKMPYKTRRPPWCAVLREAWEVISSAKLALVHLLLYEAEYEHLGYDDAHEHRERVYRRVGYCR